MLTEGTDDRNVANGNFLYGGKNVTGQGKYTLLEAEGRAILQGVI
jgi:hypothetical protein